MEAITLYLAQVLGIYLMVMGIVMAVRQKYFIPVIGLFSKEKLDRVLFATIEFLAGLFFVLGYQKWGSAPEIIISIFAWMALLEGLMYLLISDKGIESVFRVLNRKEWYWAGGAASVVIGAYLAAVGFGVM